MNGASHSALEALAGTAVQYARFMRQRFRRAPAGSPSEQSRHLLLLAWLFPPIVSGGVYRPLAFAKYAARQGWKVTVVAAPHEGPASAAGEYLLKQLPPSVRVLRVKDSRAIVSHKLFPRIDGGFVTVLDTFDTVVDEIDTPPSVVLSSGPPFHNFVAGWMLSRFFRRPLVLDYRDEWTSCPFPFVHTGNVDERWERRCLRDAAAVVMTTRSFIEHAQGRFEELDAKRAHCIMNGWEPADLPDGGARAAVPHATRSCELLYLGYLGEHVPVNGFLSTFDRAIANLEGEVGHQVALRFVGSRSAVADASLKAYGTPARLRIDNQVPKPEALDMMRKARALLIINEPDLSRYIPGKLFDYIASRTPVLVYGDGGEVARIVRELGAGFVVRTDDVAGMAQALLALSQASVGADPALITDWLSRHTRERSAMDLLALLEDLG